MKSLDLSIVVPLYNEEDSVDLLHGRISDALRDTGLDYEILFVDDGSETERCIALSRLRTKILGYA